MTIGIAELMESSGVKFGTSGARGLAEAITDRVAYCYTRAFLRQQSERFGRSFGAVVVGGDLRPSTPRIMSAVGVACEHEGMQVIHAGFVPSPAVALAGIAQGVPSIMVTGSHIPDDRNGIKFNRFDGEIDKQDEQEIRRASIELAQGLFDEEGALQEEAHLPPVDATVALRYRERFTRALPSDCLKGLRVGVYQHSTVGRDLLLEVLQALGADAVALGRSERFVPVDTEALRPEDVVLARQWAAEGTFDSIVSADGDCDRPLVADETGKWLRGDVLGVLSARFLGARVIATPVSCNSVAEKCGYFARVQRTRIGSPFVIEAMQTLAAEGEAPVVGYEANGGFLQQSPLPLGQVTLSPLPTRDAVLPILSALLLSRREGTSLSGLSKDLPQRFTASGRAKEFPTENAHERIRSFVASDSRSESATSLALIGEAMPWVSAAAVSVDQTDGLRITFANDEVVHLRPSGNAPELRCYTEAGSEARAEELLRFGLALIESWR